LWHKKRGDEMSPRTGRPRVDKPKTIEVKARIDEETNERLEEYCKKNQVSRTDVVRLGIKKVLERE
jgi:hypothetical protein